MTKISMQVRAVVEMAHKAGIGPAFKLIKGYANARFVDNYRGVQFRRMKLYEPVVRDILGYQMLLDPRVAGLDRDLLLDGIREPAATGYIMRLLSADDIVLEVGANIGYYALMEARLCSHVYAVEPHPDNYRRLKQNIELNHIKNISCYAIAFGSQSASIPMYCSVSSNWHSCKNRDEVDNSTITVECMRIDDFVAGKEIPTFIKMDVEGYELEVLKGAEETLKSVRCVFLELHGDILAHPEIREVIERLEAAGLVPSILIQHDRPGLSQIHSVDQIGRIYEGDRGTYEIFYVRY